MDQDEVPLVVTDRQTGKHTRRQTDRQTDTDVELSCRQVRWIMLK